MIDDDELTDLVQRVRGAASTNSVLFEPKALRELDHMDWSVDAALDVLRDLTTDDYDRTEWSSFHGGVDLHTFMPPLDHGDLFIRLYIRADVVCVSFHWA